VSAGFGEGMGLRKVLGFGRIAVNGINDEPGIVLTLERPKVGWRSASV
jgi:hypothetical protein